MVFSATKGIAATVIHRLVDRGLLCYDAQVAEYWPEFGANGKSQITVRDVLRHRSELSHLNGVTPTARAVTGMGMRECPSTLAITNH